MPTAHPAPITQPATVFRNATPFIFCPPLNVCSARVLGGHPDGDGAEGDSRRHKYRSGHSHDRMMTRDCLEPVTHLGHTHTCRGSVYARLVCVAQVLRVRCRSDTGRSHMLIR